MFTPRVLNRSATPCLGLEVFEVSNLRRCCTHGSTVFAPVVRGEDPDREAALRTASEHSADRGEDRPGQVHGEPRAEARPVVRVQRERVVPPLPAETAEDRAVDLGPFYSALAAQRKADLRGADPASRVAWTRTGFALGAGLAAQGWSPELIEGRLKAQYAGDPSMRISTSAFTSGSTPSRSGAGPAPVSGARQETPDEEKGQEGERAAHPDARAIADRPEAVGSRKGFGHFESVCFSKLASAL